MKQLYNCFLLVFLFASKIGIAQSFTTRVSANVIGKKDVVQVEYIAENLELQELVLPVFNGWAILAGPNFSSNRIQTGNLVKQEVIYTLTLQPQATGRLTIPGARATIDNKIRVSNVATVEVKDVAHVQGSGANTGRSRSTPQPDVLDEVEVNDEQLLRSGENARDKIKNNLLVRLDVNKKTSYVGEPLLVTYKLCTRIRSQSRVVKQPAFSGCTVLEMTTDDPLPRKEMINGRWYNVYVIRQVQLIPLQAGPLELPEASVENTVTFYRAGHVNYRDLFYNNPASKPEELTVTFKNGAQQVMVKPLPQPAPESFGGAVGNFAISLSSTDGSKDANQTNGLLVKITGEGNLQQNKVPVVSWPTGIEGFEANEREEMDKQVFPLRVSKIITYPFVAAKSGAYIIPPVEFTYFDAKKSQYITIESQALKLNVVKASKDVFARSAPGTGIALYTRLYLAVGAALLFALAGIVWYNKRNKKPQAAPAVPPAVLKQQVIAAAPQIDTHQFVFQMSELEPSGDGPAFYRQLHKIVTAWLLGKFNISVEEIASFSVNNPDKASDLQKLVWVLSHCSVGMYTPMYNVEEAMQHRLVALEALNSLEKRS